MVKKSESTKSTESRPSARGSSSGRSRPSRGKKSRSRKKSSRDRKIQAIDTSRKTLNRLQDPLLGGHYIVFDIETTGGNPERNGITEIFAIKYRNGKQKDTFYSLIDPKIPVPPIVRRMTGITNKMLKGQPTVDQVMPGFIDFIGNDILVSHNTIGDMKFVRYFAEQTTGKIPDNFFLCTHLLVEKLFPQAPDKSLKGLTKYFELDTGEFHRAEADSYATLAIFEIFMNELDKQKISLIRDAIRFQGDLESGARLGWAVKDNQLADLHDGPGVFSLKDQKGKVVFVSSAISVARDIQKLRNHSQLPRQLLRTVLQTYDLKVQKADTVLAALLQESKLLAKHKPRVSPGQWHQRVFQCIHMTDLDEGKFRIDVGPIPENASFVMGPVRDRKKVVALLEDIGSVLDEKMGRKGLVLDNFHRDSVEQMIRGNLETMKKSASKSVRKFTNLFRPKLRKTRKETLDVLTRLAELDSFPAMQDGFAVNGFAACASGRNKSIIYKVVQGRIVDQFSASSAFDHWEPTSEELDSLTGKQATALADNEATLMNSTLWWIFGSKVDGKFLDKQSLSDQNR